MPSRRPQAAASVADAEFAVLKVLWQIGPAVVRDVQQALEAHGRVYAYTTVQTLLQRLCDKGLVRKDERATAHVFAAALSREQHASARVTEVVDDVLDGALAPLLLGLLPNSRFTAAEIAQFRALLDAAERRAAGQPEGGDA